MPVEVAAGAVPVLSGARVGVAGEDLGVAERHSGVEGVGDGGVPQGVRADVTGNARDLGDADDHAVAVASVDRVVRQRSQDQRTLGAFASAGLQDPEDRDG